MHQVLNAAARGQRPFSLTNSPLEKLSTENGADLEGLGFLDVISAEMIEESGTKTEEGEEKPEGDIKEFPKKIQLSSAPKVLEIEKKPSLDQKIEVGKDIGNATEKAIEKETKKVTEKEIPFVKIPNKHKNDIQNTVIEKDDVTDHLVKNNSEYDLKRQRFFPLDRKNTREKISGDKQNDDLILKVEKQEKVNKEKNIEKNINDESLVINQILNSYQEKFKLPQKIKDESFVENESSIQKNNLSKIDKLLNKEEPLSAKIHEKIGEKEKSPKVLENKLDKELSNPKIFSLKDYLAKTTEERSLAPTSTMATDTVFKKNYEPLEKAQIENKLMSFEEKPIFNKKNKENEGKSSIDIATLGKSNREHSLEKIINKNLGDEDKRDSFFQNNKNENSFFQLSSQSVEKNNLHDVAINMTSNADPKDFVNLMIDRIKQFSLNSTPQKQESLSIVVNHENLGELKILVSQKPKEDIKVKIVSSSEEMVNEMNKQKNQIVEQLNSQGIKVSEFVVDRTEVKKNIETILAENPSSNKSDNFSESKNSFRPEMNRNEKGNERDNDSKRRQELWELFINQKRT